MNEQKKKCGRRSLTTKERTEWLQQLKDDGFIFCPIGEKIFLEAQYTTMIGSNDYLTIPIKGEDGKLRGTNFHRLVLEAALGTPIPKGMQTDHIDRNRKNNHSMNLRLCTLKENRQNLGVRSDNVSGYRGVCFNRNTYMARIKVGEKLEYLGSYKEPKLAALCFDFIARNVFPGYVSPYTAQDFANNLQSINTGFLFKKLRTLKACVAA